MAKRWPWRRKSEGFEWHKYVKTTIAVRREQRRERAEEIKRSAQDGAVRAAEEAVRLGRRGAQAAGDGARRASAASKRGVRVGFAASARGLKHAAMTSARGIRQVAVASVSGSRRFLAASGRGIRHASLVSAHGIGRASAISAAGIRRASVASARGLAGGARYAGAGLGASGRWLGRTGLGSAAWTGGGLAALGRTAAGGLAAASRPILDFLGRPGVSGPLMLAGAVALVSGLARPLLTGGLDREALLIVAIGAICLVAGLTPRLRYGIGPTILAALAAPLRRIPANLGHTLAGGGAIIAALVAAVWLWPASLTPSMPDLPSLPSMSLSSFVPFKASEPPIVGRAFALGGDTLRVGRQTVRLEGIEAPERDQTCMRGDHRRWRCGEAAQAALSRLVSGRQVHCAPVSKDDTGTVRATCTIGKTDVAAALVEGGHVLAESGLMPRYRSEQAKAEQHKAGLWVGGATPERPDAWRTRLWNEARAKAPEGCPIKGKVAGRRGDTVKTYHLPWSPTYMRLRVISARGERWFCSEADARAAGFAPAEIDG
ncbi:MAG TPA: thermonuclease family protein [Hyphomicrobiaceae bacterium]|nr:thermonuclease family protein [Hyphomicrobiaceae bacterium]